MNEWSPGGNFSCPVTPNQNCRSHRYTNNESEKRTKPLALNKRGQSECKSRSYLQYSMEDVSKGLSPGSKKKGGGNGTADPRFKRVVPSGVQNDACVGTGGKTGKQSGYSEKKSRTSSKFPIWNAPEFIPNKSHCDCNETLKQSAPNTMDNCETEKVTDTEGFNLNQPQDHLNDLIFNHDVVNLMCKGSESECTINTRNTSLVSEESGQEITNTLTRVPSPVRVKKVENWMHDQGPKLERKHSVVTVIGQMQEPDILSSALQEIDKRRKLVKELDRFAVCRKIIETDKEKEISDLMLKISALNSNRSVLMCDSNETVDTTSHCTNGCGDKINKDSELSNTEYSLNNNELNVDSSVPMSKKSSTVGRNIKKHRESKGSLLRGNQPTVLGFEAIIKQISVLLSSVTGLINHMFHLVFLGSLQMFFSNASCPKSFWVWIVLSGVMMWFAFFSFQNPFISLDIFNSKPKPITWYEKIFQWLWEIFRPSNVSFPENLDQTRLLVKHDESTIYFQNYHRTSQWRSY